MSPDGAAVYDRDRAIEQLAGDESLFRAIAAAFADECESYCGALQEATASGDVAVLRREAHSAKSMLASFACDGGRSLAQRLELLAASGSVVGAAELTAELVAAMRSLAAALEKEAAG